MDILLADYDRRIRAAEGYIELGMHLDANEELEGIELEARGRTSVLRLRLRIYFALQKWELMRAAAKDLALRDGDNPRWVLLWAFAVRRSESIAAARLILLEAVERMPSAANLHYNLACYECQLGDMEVAKARLQRAFKIDVRLRVRALEEEDLHPLWEAP